VGRVVRHIERKHLGCGPRTRAACAAALHRPAAARVEAEDQGKFYSVNAPELQCIGEGKARRRHEFVVKGSIATTSRNRFLLAARGLLAIPSMGTRSP